MRIERQGQAAVITMQRTENRFNPEHLDELEDALDQVGAMDGHPAAVLTGEDKYFSNGLDLEWAGTVEPADAKAMVERTMRLFARILTAPFGIVAAINGHCFAAGAMMALACDARVMRADRGFFCLPEVDIDMVFLPGMSALVADRLSPVAAHETMLTGGRLTAAESAALGIVDDVAAADLVVGTAVDRAARFAGKNPDTVTGIKRGLYSGLIEKLNLPIEL
jgi:enoyl-CoA hydratase/carnithine racemase